MTNKKSSAGIHVGLFAAGALAGAIAGILLAPKSGKKTREDIKAVVLKIKDETVDKLSQLKDVTKEQYDSIIAKIVEAYTDRRELTTEQAQDIKQTLIEGFEDLKKVAQDTGRAIKKDLAG